MNDELKQEFAAAFRQRGFVLVLVIFAISAVGLRAATQSLGLHFKKERVELRGLLDSIPRQLGPWLQINKDVPLPDEQEHALGTKDYISREYVDTRQMAGFDRATWDKQSEETRNRMVGALLQRTPQAMVNLHIAYYTGLVDTVAHIPERCYVAGGFDPIDPQVVTFDVFKDVPGRNPHLKAKFTNYVDRSQGGRARNVAYLFQVNGAYEFDSFLGVRGRLQNIFERYGYYAKIELSTTLGDRTQLAQETMADFLRSAMPEIEKRLPDWKRATGEDAVLNANQ